MTFDYPSHGFDEAVACVCHGTATEEQMRQLNLVLRENAAARDEYLFRLELHSRLASEPELFATSAANVSCVARLESGSEGRRSETKGSVVLAGGSLRGRSVWALAACVALLLVGAWWLGRSGFMDHRWGTTRRSVAMLNRVVNVRWDSTVAPPRLGAPLEPGKLRLDSGLAQIVFYNGARVVMEGPAEMDLVSSSKAVFVRGKLTADVPTQARGFRVVAPGLDVTDLGTSFGLNVRGERTELHVFQGAVSYRAGVGVTDQRLSEGRGAVVEGKGAPRLVDADSAGFASLFELQAKSVVADARRYDDWREANRLLNEDASLWVHFDFEHGVPSDWRLPNTGALRATVPDATIVGCEWTEGRWPAKPGLEFRGVSDRVRLEVPGALNSVTLAAWVRVQGLDRQINSLFMSDGFERGTLHWVIRNDGVLGLTVIGTKGGHQILASPPVMTVDQFGIWTHLAVVLDGESKRVVHYVNGEAVSEHSTRFGPPFQVGAAELGNWNAVGFPGNDPFLIRNFSGVMDEFCLFGRALDADEMSALYAEGKPQPDTGGAHPAPPRDRRAAVRVVRALASP